VTGAAGMLGTALIDRLAEHHEVVATSRRPGLRREGVRWSVFDLRDDRALETFLLTERPDFVVHAAAIVDVDRCERDPVAAERLHVHSTEVIAQTLATWDAALIYISTDSVFDGHKDGPYVEADRPAPINTYARTKLAGEKVALALKRSAVLRTNIFGWTGADRMSFAEWVIHGLLDRTPMRMFSDVQFTPIHVSHLSEVVDQLLRSVDDGAVGLFHAGGETCLTKYEFAYLVANVFDLSTEHVSATRVADAGLAASRPTNMALSSQKLSRTLGRDLPAAVDGIELMQRQYDNGWVARIKGRSVAPGYRFWETT
jgi:dTDP-4-dehydrorhamnose reductase